MKIIKDDLASSTLSLFFIFGILLIVAAFAYFIIATISDAGGLVQALKDIGEDAGSWNSGTTLGANTQKYNIFNNGRKIWRNFFG